MNKETQAISNDMRQLAEDAQALMSATADVAGEKVGEARKRLAAALERGKDIGDVPAEYAALPKSLAESNFDGRVVFEPKAGEVEKDDDEDEGDADDE
jgi:hypothetical protein